MEKQISVDPVSLTRADSASNIPPNLLPPPLAAKTRSGFKFSCSLPNSALSSPVSTKTTKKGENQFEMWHSVALNNLERLRRSKSCGEGRASQPSLDFDHLRSTYNTQHEVMIEPDAEEDEEPSSDRDKFRCGACLFLPSLSKGRTVVKGNNKEELSKFPSDGGGNACIISLDEHVDLGILTSQRASLERFECGSWRSHGGTMSNLFYDLPVELIRCVSVNDTESPVTEGFVFDNKDRQQQQQRQRGGLKGGAASSTCTFPGRCNKESGDSSRHVRFSTSSPPASPCITPRLRKARDEFNALVEAQNG